MITGKFRESDMIKTHKHRIPPIVYLYASMIIGMAAIIALHIHKAGPLAA